MAPHNERLRSVKRYDWLKISPENGLIGFSLILVASEK